MSPLGTSRPQVALDDGRRGISMFKNPFGGSLTRDVEAGDPYVCHVVHEYLGHTLNWIYCQLMYTPGYSPYVLTTNILNSASYPLEHVFSPQTLRVLRLKIVDRAFRRLGYYPPDVMVCYLGAIRRFPPSLIHAHFGWDGYFALSIKKLLAVPMITRFYGYDIGQLPCHPLWLKRYRRLFKECDLFLTEGQYMKASLVKLGCPESKIVVHHLGVEEGKIPHRSRETEPNRLRILIAASFTEKKGIEYALRGVARAMESWSDTEVLVTIIGDGVLKDELHTLSASLGIRDRIVWLGHQPHERFIEELSRADLFVSPSVTAADGNTEGGAPVALLEAQAAGLPVISTFHADIPEVVRDGVTGILVPERDAEAIFAAIGKFREEPNRIAAFGAAGRRHVEQNHSAQKQGLALKEVYDRLICH